MNQTARHNAIIRQSLLDAFQEHGLRFIEKYAQENLLKSFADDINETQANALQNAFETAYPRIKNGRLLLPTNDADLLRLFDSNVNLVAQFSLLSYVTNRGTDIHPLRNPAGIFNDEFKESSDEDGHLRQESRMGQMTTGAYAREKLRAKQSSELWCGMSWRAMSEVAALAICRYGIHAMPAFLHWKQDNLAALAHQLAPHDVQDDEQGVRLHKLRRFAHGIIAPYDIVFRDKNGDVLDVSHALDAILLRIYSTHLQDFVADTEHFRASIGSLCDATGTVLFISHTARHEMYVTDEFVIWLSEQPNWDDLANGVIEHGVADVLTDSDANNPAMQSAIDLLV